MADISKITLPNGSVYNIKDAAARESIENIDASIPYDSTEAYSSGTVGGEINDIKTAITGGVVFEGETTTPLTDGATTTSIVINGVTVTAAKGMLVVYGGKEFVFDGTKWIEMGDLSLIGDLGWKDSASATYTPAGTVSQPTFTGTSSNVAFTVRDVDENVYQSGTFPIDGSVSQPTFTGSSMTATGTYTPAGTVAAPTISVATAGTTTTVNSITDVGTLPTLTTTVVNENLTIAFSQGTLPTKGVNTTVKTGDAAYTATAPAFTGTQETLTVTGTPSGTVSQPTFTGYDLEVTASVVPLGSVSQPTFTGTQATITVT